MDNPRTITIYLVTGDTMTIEPVDFFDAFEVALFFNRILGGASDGGYLAQVEFAEWTADA